MAGVTAGLVRLADSSAPQSRYVTMGVGMLLYQFAIGLVNDVVDVPQDRLTKPWKPLARGPASSALAATLAAACVLSGVVLTSTLSQLAWLIGIAGLVCGLSYDLYLKRTALSWLPYALGLPLVPVWVYAASETWRPLLWWSLPLGAVLGFALNLANEAPDAAAGRHSGLAGKIGRRRARLTSLAAFAAVVCTLVLLLAARSPMAGLAAFAIGGTALVVSPWSTRCFGRDGLFGLLAVASALLTVLFLGAVETRGG